MSTEIELKFAVDGSAAFDALTKHLDVPAREFHRKSAQANHFFDSQGFDLQAHGVVLRLREEKGVSFLTLKGKEERRTDDGIATERVEVEVRLSPQTAVDVLRGSLSPRSVLEKRAGQRAPEALQLLDDALGRAELHYVGQFENQRTRLAPIPVVIEGEPVPLVFELDKTRFSADRTDYEIEVELTREVDPKAAQHAIAAILDEAGIAWRGAPSKAQRFFEIVRGKE